LIITGVRLIPESSSVPVDSGKPGGMIESLSDGESEQPGNGSSDLIAVSPSEIASINGESYSDSLSADSLSEEIPGFGDKDWDAPEGLVKPIVIAPGDKVPDFDLDILFIHAHPDDESLDYGCLMALAHAAGLKIGLLTFTDGESGLDLYPNRPVDGIYPDHYMEGEELASVRAGEVSSAAGVLGADLLIRFGLKNHPYNGKKDELPPEEILEIWGGKAALSNRILDIISKTSPSIVVAPDIPGRASEHFEHEAVGYISAEIMNSLSPDDPKSPERFITCIDPRQHDLYPEASFINAALRIKNGKPDGKKSSLREVQLSALSMHKTQNDAAIVGTGFLPEYPSEYYQIQFWRTEETWYDWIYSLYQ